MKTNIRKTIALKRLEHKEKYKRLTGVAMDSKYLDSRKLREAEDREWKKFMFYNGLQCALDKIKEDKE